MNIFIINILSLFVWQYIYKKNINIPKIKIYIMFGILLQFVVLQGFRDYSVGADTLKYVKYYNYFRGLNISLSEMLMHPPLAFERGYLTLMYICDVFNVSSRMFIVIISIIINILILRFIYYISDDFILSIWLFIALEYFSLSFTMLRQMIAIGLILNSYIYIERKEKYKSLGLILIAILFHKTAIVFLPFYIIFNMKICNSNNELLKKGVNFFKSYKLIICISIIFFSKIILTKPILLICSYIYPGYVAVHNNDFPTLFFVMMGILIISIIIESKHNVKNERYQQLQFLMFASCLIQIFVIEFSEISRASLNTYVFIIALLPLMINKIDNKKLKFSFELLIYLLTFVQYYFFSMNVYNLLPYSFGFA